MVHNIRYVPSVEEMIAQMIGLPVAEEIQTRHETAQLDAKLRLVEAIVRANADYEKDIDTAKDRFETELREYYQNATQRSRADKFNNE